MQHHTFVVATWFENTLYHQNLIMTPTAVRRCRRLRSSTTAATADLVLPRMVAAVVTVLLVLVLVTTQQPTPCYVQSFGGMTTMMMSHSGDATASGTGGNPPLLVPVGGGNIVSRRDIVMRRIPAAAAAVATTAAGGGAAAVTTTGMVGASSITGLLAVTSYPHSVVAATTATPTTTRSIDAADADTAKSLINAWLNQLEKIPVFCIVDQNNGANYMVIKPEEGLAVGYAFTTLDGAVTVLVEAQKTARAKNYFPVWENATVTTIPMSIAIRLALKKRPRTTPKEQTLDSIVMIIPGAGDRQDGIAVDDRFKDQGRVPLFYVTEANNNDDDDDDVLRLYFTRKDLLRSWTEHHPNERLPPIQALDLVAMFENTMRGRADLYLPTLSRKVEFVPTAVAVTAAQELQLRGPPVPYSATKMIV